MRNPDSIYIINPNYLLINDRHRVILTYRYHSVLRSPEHYEADVSFLSFIHPYYIYIFSFFDGKNKWVDVVGEIANALNSSIEKTENILGKFIQNKTTLGVEFKGDKFAFPRNFLVPFKDSISIYTYDPDDFIIDEYDFTQLRLFNYPLDITFMVNTICAVDCIYCYADCRKKMDCQIPKVILEKLIKECRDYNVRTFNLMGGEFLMYKHWKWLAKELIRNGYDPYISTKIPIDIDIIRDLLDLKIKKFQISLDSFDPRIIEKNLNITNGLNYIEKMKNTLKCFNDTDISLTIHAVITIYNKAISHLKSFLNTLSQYTNIVNVQLTIVGHSLYKNGYDIHKLPRKDVMEISDFVNEINLINRYSYNINLSATITKDKFLTGSEQKLEYYNKRSLCTANIQQIYILPNGDVSICEELMFNPNFILGNILQKSLLEIWQCNPLKKLTNKEFYNNSLCGKCLGFDSCRAKDRQGVCWKEVLHAYGEENWNYPDPKCPYAPLGMRSFFIE